MRDALPSPLAQRCAERLGDARVAADGLVARRGGRRLGWCRAALVTAGLGGLAIIMVEGAPLPGTAAALLLAVMRSLSVDGETGRRHTRRRDVPTGGEACGTGE